MTLKPRRFVKSLLFVIGISLLFFGIRLLLENSKTKVEKNESAYTNNVGCTRTTRLDNKPQYDRALSLIQQRIEEHNNGYKSKDDQSYFKYFTPELVNCVKIIDEDPEKRDDFEGYFVLNSKEIKPDYYPIIVNSKYLESDDIGIVLLLSHELTHVQQYIDANNNKKKISCLDNEANAFMATRIFYIYGLNFQETAIVEDRIKKIRSVSSADNNTESVGLLQKYVYSSFSTPFVMVDLVQKLVRESKCQKVENSDDLRICLNLDIHKQLTDLLKEDSFYKKQCGL